MHITSFSVGSHWLKLNARWYFCFTCTLWFLRTLASNKQHLILFWEVWESQCIRTCLNLCKALFWFKLKILLSQKALRRNILVHALSRYFILYYNVFLLTGFINYLKSGILLWFTIISLKRYDLMYTQQQLNEIGKFQHSE